MSLLVVEIFSVLRKNLLPSPFFGNILCVSDALGQQLNIVYQPKSQRGAHTHTHAHEQACTNTHVHFLSPMATEVFRPASGHRYIANDQVETLLDPVAPLTLLA